MSTKKLQIVGSISRQPDWSQNDETAVDYVKNRTHWEEKTFEEILPENTLTMTYFADWYIGSATVDHTKMILDKIYTIVWDGVEYESKSFIVENATEGEIVYTVAIGNPAFVELGDDNGIPVMCTNAVNNGEIIDTFAVLTADSGETHTLSISYGSSIVHQLDEKFISDTIARISDIPSRVVPYIAQDTVPEDTSVLWVDTSESSCDPNTSSFENFATKEYVDNAILSIKNIEAVLYTLQELTEEQKAQARANIGATAIRVSMDNGVLSIE